MTIIAPSFNLETLLLSFIRNTCHWTSWNYWWLATAWVLVHSVFQLANTTDNRQNTGLYIMNICSHWLKLWKQELRVILGSCGTALPIISLLAHTCFTHCYHRATGSNTFLSQRLLLCKYKFHSCLHWNICRLHQPNLQKFQHKYQSLILQLNAIQDRLTWFTVAVQRGGFIRSYIRSYNVAYKSCVAIKIATQWKSWLGSAAFIHRDLWSIHLSWLVIKGYVLNVGCIALILDLSSF